MIKTWSTLEKVIRLSRFQDLIMKNPLQKHLNSLQKAEVYFQAMRASTIQPPREHTPHQTECEQNVAATSLSLALAHA